MVDDSVVNPCIPPTGILHNSRFLAGIVLFCFALQLHTTDDAMLLDRGQFTAIPQQLEWFASMLYNTNTQTTHTSRISEYKSLCVAVQSQEGRL